MSYHVLTSVGRAHRVAAVAKLVSAALERAGGRPVQGRPDLSKPHIKWTR
jgi:hypothetical protein